MSRAAPVFPKVPLEGPRFGDVQAIKKLRLALMSGFSHAFHARFVPIRANLFETRNAAFRLSRTSPQCRLAAPAIAAEILEDYRRFGGAGDPFGRAIGRRVISTIPRMICA
jgi:hypothetical protein